MSEGRKGVYLNEKEKSGEVRRLSRFLRNAFYHGVSAWRIGNQAALSNFVLIPNRRVANQVLALKSQPDCVMRCNRGRGDSTAAKNASRASHLSLEMAQAGQYTTVERIRGKLRGIRQELRSEYLEDHNKPWIIGFSGGKDSTLLAHLVFECLMAIAPDERKRPVYIVSNDTLVESPVFQSFVDRLLEEMTEGTSALRLPVKVVKTHPLVGESFWVNLLGRGYPAPNRTFRWCTDRMKIRPTSRFIREIVQSNGEAVLLLGVRRSESAARSGTISKHESGASGRLSPHADHKGVWIFSPIKELTTEEVWITLLNSRPPWGGSYRDVVKLYKSAQGMECPFVMSSDDAPSCGSSSARFGCWTCTVVEKDNSLESLIAAGNEYLEPLAEFRRRLKEVSENPDCRSKVRRNGQPGLGPITLPVRGQLLEELLEIQSEVGITLISEVEVHLIRDQWSKDQAEEAWREFELSTAQYKIPIQSST